MPLSRRRLLLGLGALPLGVRGPAAHAESADFYQGKTLTLIVGFAPGGGVDTTARVVAKHFVRFIPGQPALVVQNMEGAAGLIAANYLDRRVTPDGLTLAVPGRSWFLEGITKNPSATFDATRLSYIGAPGVANSMLYVRPDTGIGSFDDFRSSKRTITFGSLGSTTPTGMVPRMLGIATGASIKVIFGYVSTARVLLAIEQGELDAVFTNEDSFSRRQDLLQKKIVVPILQNRPSLPGLPLLRDVVPAEHWPLLNLVMSLENFGLPFVGPRAVPAERVEILRNAFKALFDDKEYQAEAARVHQPIIPPIEGATLTSMMAELAASATPDLVAAYRRLGSGK
jgi:hypothetical protein